MQIRFLVIEETEIRLLGFPLKLTPSEKRLLIAIAEHGSISIEELMPLLNAGVSRGNVAVHINAINRKSERISQRKLIVFHANAYKINPFM
jgi:DNA-binding MarR family transcriptional regulator